ncbi:hypothetical protein CDL15_Pgr024162 [Punica granatum]|uniref:Uncharacterized protein n=1 Tax=Punica granatum TaxID=22663 RepID=A0A218XWT2_PUNGR|nr:hypothetical protein CDL15_Pgr024162 [Punica granatum]
MESPARHVVPHGGGCGSPARHVVPHGGGCGAPSIHVVPHPVISTLLSKHFVDLPSPSNVDFAMKHRRPKVSSHSLLVSVNPVLSFELSELRSSWSNIFPKIALRSSQ